MKKIWISKNVSDKNYIYIYIWNFLIIILNYKKLLWYMLNFINNNNCYDKLIIF